MSRQKVFDIRYYALYLRLSQEDDNEGDSNSIINQRRMLTEYAEVHGFTPYEIFLDDGYSGTNFERPGVQRLLREVDAGRIAAVIVKDMSRFGRNYLEVGMYTEVKFPQRGTRFIAVNDNVDSENGMDDFTPIRNLFNEFFARDTSRKIRAQKQNVGKAGIPLSTHAPYGYRKDPANKKGWLIDEEAARVVRRIFQLYTEGMGTRKIANILTRDGVLTPTNYSLQYRSDDCLYKSMPHSDSWAQRTIAQILTRREYLGDLVNFKTFRPSYKSKKVLLNPVENQLVFENKHPAIIDRDTWNAVQKRWEQRTRPTRSNVPDLFSNLLYCADCGSKLYTYQGKGVREKNYVCSAHHRNSKVCSQHKILACALEKVLLAELNTLFAFAREQEKQFLSLLEKHSAQRGDSSLAQKRREMARLQKRLNEIAVLIPKLYEDNSSGVLTTDLFQELAEKYTGERNTLRQKMQSIQKEVNQLEDQSADTKQFLKVIRKYTCLSELSFEALHELIDKILIYSYDKESDSQRIDIFYNFNIGAIRIPFDNRNTA